MDAKVQMIRTWSFSALTEFESCAYRSKLKRIDKIPEPERPLPPGKTEHANDRGSRVHDCAEKFVKGEMPLISELRSFEQEFLVLQNLYKQGLVSLEGEWATDQDWNPCAWTGEATWQRLKLDACVFMDEVSAVVIDYKTGKRFGNEIKHTEQTQLYAINTFLRYPKLEEIWTELWYTDVNELHQQRYLRHQALAFRPRWHSRAIKMTTATEFKPRPNMFSCKWCAYKSVEKGGSGHCDKGV